jgi:ParB/RepB/Spo0J family partition protein
MARSFSFPSKRFEGFSVSPGSITVDWNDNGRAFQYTKEDIQDLLQDFEEGQGIQQPIVVKPWKTEENPKGLKILAGFRRLYAAIVWADTHDDFTIPVIIEEPEDRRAELVLNIRENVARKDLSHIDLGHNAQLLQAEGMTVDEASKVLGVSQAQVSQHLKLVNELPEIIQQAIHYGRITADDAYALLKVENSEERLRFFYEHLKETNGSTRDSDSSDDSSESLERGDASDAPVGPARKKGRTSIREKVREAGVNVGGVRMPGFKKYLQQALEEEGPGSNKGEVELKRSLLDYLDGELTDKQLDNRFEKFCRQKGF